MIKDNISVTIFAIIIGRSTINTPYINQHKTPVVKIKNIESEISLVLLVL